MIYFLEKKIEFTRPLKDSEFEEWSRAVLECEINKRNVHTRWYKDSVEIYPNDRYHIEVEDKVQRLIFNRIELDETSSYTCSFRQAKTTANLTVKELPYQFVRPLEESVTIVEKQPLTLECESNKPLKDNPIVWTRNGQALVHSPSDGVLIKTSDKIHSLTIYECHMKDDGLYECTIKNSSTSCKVVMKGEKQNNLFFEQNFNYCTLMIDL